MLLNRLYISNNTCRNLFDKYVHHYNIQVLNIFGSELQLINTKPMIKNKLKELLSEVKKFKVQKILILEYKKKNHHKIFHSSVKLNASDSDNDEEFISIHQSIMARIKNYADKDWIAFYVIIKNNIKVSQCTKKWI